ncbi:MAG TPA: ABC transporter permease, partial [Clostridia bacterium]|nr:ABC transporter permease [Clostridia bacterium]
MDTFYFIIQRTLPVAIPLLLVALGGMFSERSGIINIALDGIMIVGG